MIWEGGGGGVLVNKLTETVWILSKRLGWLGGEVWGGLLSGGGGGKSSTSMLLRARGDEETKSVWRLLQACTQSLSRGEERRRERDSYHRIYTNMLFWKQTLTSVRKYGQISQYLLPMFVAKWYSATQINNVVLFVGECDLSGWCKTPEIFQTHRWTRQTDESLLSFGMTDEHLCCG